MRHFTLSATFTRTTDIHIGKEILFSEEILSLFRGRQVALFCDETIYSLTGKRLEARLPGCGCFTFSSGEKSKNRETKQELEDRLFFQKWGKETLFVALGGGVTMDLVGYLASTFCRGVSLAYIPTTLLGMVDACLGGKTGVNTPFGKNLVGTFYPASHLVIDSSLLNTLPEREWKNGLAEVFKYALIASPSLFEKLECFERKESEEIIAESLAIKAGIVQEDFEERQGKRRILNFGHTIAHALEVLEGFHLSHGEAVVIGMWTESWISKELGMLSLESFQKIETLLFKLSPPPPLSAAVTEERVEELLALDKKAIDKTPRFVILESLGKCASFEEEYCTPIPPSLLREALSLMVQRFASPLPLSREV